MNILITSAGRRVSLVKYFQKEAKRLLGAGSKVYTTDLEPQSASACHISDGGLKVGRFGDDDYMEYLMSLCKKYDIKLVVPTLDPELLLLSEHKEAFEKEGIQFVVSDTEFVQKCRDKRKINKFFREKGFLIPEEIDIKNPIFPMFIKPIDGSNSKDLYFIKDKSMLSDYLINHDNLMYLEYLSAEEYKEYTVDMYYDKSSVLKCIVPRVRLAVRGGETNKGITDKNSQIIDFLSEKLSTIEGARGCLTLQLFLGKTNNKIYGIEINPRFGGGYPLSYLSGANYPGWLIQEYLLGEEVASFGDWEDKLLLLRYDTEMVVHGS
jgi:carbamoyl-phosphate synthase large subunit